MTQPKAEKPSRLRSELLETATDMHRLGIMDDATFGKITMRSGDQMPASPVVPLTGDDIRGLREQARLSQAVFAKYLNLTTSYISQLERGARRPTGAALLLLNIIRRKGIEAIL